VDEVRRWGNLPASPRVARGCDACAGSGYRGRRGIYELFVPDEALRSAIVAGTSPDVMRTRAMAIGTVPLRDEGWRLVRDGVTTPEELVRAMGEADG
jgi:type II secretory ATPase GspE/PulE/Tfp pilus assembly ATPase PilB-like protein